MVIIRDDAEVQIHPQSDSGYYVVVNNANPSNDEATELFAEFTVETAISTLERLATKIFQAAPQIAFRPWACLQVFWPAFSLPQI